MGFRKTKIGDFRVAMNQCFEYRLVESLINLGCMVSEWALWHRFQLVGSSR